MIGLDYRDYKLLPNKSFSAASRFLKQLIVARYKIFDAFYSLKNKKAPRLLEAFLTPSKFPKP